MNLPQPRWYTELNRYQWWVSSWWPPWGGCSTRWISGCLSWHAAEHWKNFWGRRPPRERQIPGEYCHGHDANRLGNRGLIFGTLGDRLGRVKTLMLTVATYLLFTGLSGLSLSPWDFILYRFLTGLGVGGAFGAAVTWRPRKCSARARPHALGSLQALSAIGNILGSLVGLILLPITIQMGWTVLGRRSHPRMAADVFRGSRPRLVGSGDYDDTPRTAGLASKRGRLPGEAASRGEPPVKLGSWREMWSDRRWRKTRLDRSLAGAGGERWGFGRSAFWSPELIRGHVLAQHTKEHQDRVSSIATRVRDRGVLWSHGLYLDHRPCWTAEGLCFFLPACLW